jgi:hypothetical protein
MVLRKEEEEEILPGQLLTIQNNLFYYTKFEDPALSGDSAAHTSKFRTFAMLVLSLLNN